MQRGAGESRDTYITHGKNPNESKISSEQVIQIILIQVLEQDIQAHKHYASTNGKHPCVVGGHHVDGGFVFIAGGVLIGEVGRFLWFRGQRGGDRVLQGR